MENIMNEEQRIVHKVVGRRAVKRDGLEKFEKDILIMKNEKVSFMFEKLAAYQVDYNVIEHNTSEFAGELLQLFGYIISLPLAIATALATIPTYVIRKTIANVGEKDIQRLKELGIYEILMDRIGSNGYVYSDMKTKDILFEINESKGRGL